LIGAWDLWGMTTNLDLAEQIEALVRQHVDALRTTATAAVARALAAAQTCEPARASAHAPKAVRRRKTAAPRRASDELVALGERFYAALCRQPGETMAVLAPQVGEAPRVMQVAVARLRRTGRIRAVGQRHQTRYFPMTAPSATTAAAAAAA
jgi:hypothetical protein